tara:strand:+ start:101 stop:259 length:159 start_codon:yes stop_codon:yes gene_type:complete
MAGKKKIKDAHDLAKVWSDGSLINEKALNDPENLKKIEEIFKGTIYEIKEEK